MEQLIEKINRYSQIARERALTEDETRERAQLRTAYIRLFRESFARQLDNTFVEKPDGEKIPIREWRNALARDADPSSSHEQ